MLQRWLEFDVRIRNQRVGYVLTKLIMMRISDY